MVFGEDSSKPSIDYYRKSDGYPYDDDVSSDVGSDLIDLVSTVSESDEVKFIVGVAKGEVNSELIDLVSTSSECSDDETINSIFVYSANRLVCKALLNTCSSNNFIIDPGRTRTVQGFALCLLILCHDFEFFLPYVRNGRLYVYIFLPYVSSLHFAFIISEHQLN